MREKYNTSFSIPDYIAGKILQVLLLFRNKENIRTTVNEYIQDAACYHFFNFNFLLNHPPFRCVKLREAL